MKVRPITLVATFTKARRAKEPDPIVGEFYGKTGLFWFIHRNGRTEMHPRLDWDEVR